MVLHRTKTTKKGPPQALFDSIMFVLDRYNLRLAPFDLYRLPNLGYRSASLVRVTIKGLNTAGTSAPPSTTSMFLEGLP
jgi:hypothetical protein